MFVANRIRTISSYTTPDQWSHVIGVKNLADYLTRGLTSKQLHDSSVWWDEPGKLKEMDLSIFVESSVACSEVVSATALVLRSENVRSTWSQLIEQKQKKLSDSGLASQPDAHRSIWIDKQRRIFPAEIACLTRSRLVSGDSVLKKFVPFLNKYGVLRVRTRCQSGDVQFDFPLIFDTRGQVGRAWLE